MPASTLAISLATTSRVRLGTVSRLGVIVPWRNSVLTARMPSTSAKTCASVAMPSRSEPGVSPASNVPAAAAPTEISPTSTSAPAVRP